MPTWSSGISLKGVAGSAGVSVLTGTGAPSSSLGVSGQAYVQTDVPTLYVKSGSGWSTGVSLVGPAGSAANLPKDITGNSIILAPVSGDSTATQVTIKDTSGNVLFTATAAGVSTTGALTVAGNAKAATLQSTGATTVGGNLSVAGSATAGPFVSSTAGSVSNPLLQFTATGTGNSYTAGVYSDSSLGQWFETVGGTVARSVSFVGTTPANSSYDYFTHSAYSGVSGSDVAHRWYTNRSTLALRINGSGAAFFGASLGVTGAVTAGGLALSSGTVLTFADGTTQSTASVAAPSTYAATAAGTVASPAFRYSAASAGAGMYFDANGNVLLSVNGYKSLFSTAPSGAAAGANGWAIVSTLGAGSNLLALYGSASSSTPVAAIDGAGAISGASAALSGAVTAGSATVSGLTKSAGVTLTAGVVTFADGTTQSTAAASGSSASASQFVATALGSASSPAFTQTTDSTTGAYFSGSGTSSALQIAANGTNVATFNSAGLALPSGNGGKITFADGTTQATATPAANMNNSAMTSGPSLYVNNLSLTSTPYVVPFPGSTINQVYVPLAASAFLGLTATNNSSSAITAELYDLTASKSIISLSITANSNFTGLTYASSSYAMTAGNAHVWRLTGSGSGNYLQICPFYLAPATAGANAVSTIQGFTSPTGTTFSSTAYTVQSFGVSGSKGRTWGPLRQGYLYGATATYTPSTQGAASATLSVAAYVYNVSAQTSTFLQGWSVANTGNPVSIGPYAAGMYSIPYNSALYFTVTGSGTGQLNIDAQVIT